MTFNANFNFGLISKYRAQLMGLATIGILICHAPVAGVRLPSIIKTLFIQGNRGVDIFLFLSGMGLCYSLDNLFANKQSVNKWYKKRFLRILIPYLFLMVPYWAFISYINQETVGEYLVHLSTLGFWLYHEGAWFIAFLIPLYIITPALYAISEKMLNWGGVLVLYNTHISNFHIGYLDRT